MNMVSIIVPIYNVEKYLDACVTSCLALREAFELLLVDDGSTDGSPALCDAWAAKDGRIRVIHQRNGGLSAARNSGILAAKGEYLLFLDADDFLDPGETDALLRELQAGGDPLGLGLYREYYEAEDRHVPEDPSAIAGFSGSTPLGRFLEAVPRDSESLYMIACRFLPRRQFLLDNGLLFTEGLYHEDEEWTARVFCRAESIFVTKHYFYEYRQARSASITAKVKPKHVRDKMTILNTLAKLREDAGDAVKNYLSLRMGQMYRGILLYNGLLSGSEHEALLALLRKMKPLCLPYVSGRSGRIMKLLVNVFGVKGACLLLAAVKKGRTEHEN